MRLIFTRLLVMGLVCTACDKPHCHEPEVPFPTAEIRASVLTEVPNSTTLMTQWYNPISGDTLQSTITIDSAHQCNKYRNGNGSMFGSCEYVWTECSRGYFVKIEFADSVLTKYMSYKVGRRASEFDYTRNGPYIIRFEHAASTLQNEGYRLRSDPYLNIPDGGPLVVKSAVHFRMLMTDAESAVFRGDLGADHRDEFTFLPGKGIHEAKHFVDDSLVLHLVRLE